MAVAHNIAVLMLHHVGAAGGSLTVSAKQFECQVRGLAKQGYRSISAQEFASFLAGTPLPKKSVLITFDDGFLDNWVYAHPVLKRYGMKGVLFAITGLIGDGPARPYAGQGKPLPYCPPHHAAKLQKFGGEPDSVMLRWSEIQDMVREGTFEVHSHTHTHKRWDLACAQREEKIERLHEDLATSQACLIKQLGSASPHLCWPQGYFDDDYVRTARQLGFNYLYTTDARGQNTVGTDPSHIYRFAVRNRSFSWLRRRTWLATHPFWGPAYNRWKSRTAR